MKKVMTVAIAALMLTGMTATFAGESCAKKSECSKDKKECSKEKCASECSGKKQCTKDQA